MLKVFQNIKNKFVPKSFSHNEMRQPSNLDLSDSDDDWGSDFEDADDVKTKSFPFFNAPYENINTLPFNHIMHEVKDDPAIDMLRNDISLWNNTSLNNIKNSCFENVYESIVDNIKIESQTENLKKLEAELKTKKWFFHVNRQNAEELIRNEGEGTFLIRPTEHPMSDRLLTLSVLCNEEIYHIHIRQRSDGQYSLGRQKSEELAFNSLDKMITQYQNNPLQLQKNGQECITGSITLVRNPLH